MNELLKTIKSIFTKDKHHFYTKCPSNVSDVYSVVSNQVRLANMHSYKYVFSIIYLSNSIVIKCQTYDNISESSILDVRRCCWYSKEKLEDYIDKELNVLTKEVDSSYNCYKASKNEKDN